MSDIALKVFNGVPVGVVTGYGSEVVTGKVVVDGANPVPLSGNYFEYIHTVNLTLLADSANSGNIYLGEFPLAPGASITLGFSGAPPTTLTSDEAGDILYWLGVR